MAAGRGPVRQAIVTDLRYRMALAPARTLARAGFEVTGVELSALPPKLAIGFYSNSLSDRRFLPEDRFPQALLELCREKGGSGEKPLLVPVGRRAIEAVRSLPEFEEAADFLIPSREAMELADDKWRLYTLARELDIPAPETAALSACGSLDALAGSVHYPAFIKFRNGELLGLKPQQRYAVARDPQELKSLYPEMAARDPEPIVQERAEGRDVGIAAVTDRDGELVDFLCYESLRECPASGGPTCLARTVSSPKMVEYAARLLKALRFTGISMLDFRGSPQEPLLLELNPRVWGSANLCDVANSDFFLSYARAAAGERLQCPDPARPGYTLGAAMSLSPQLALSFVSYIRSGQPFFRTCREYLSYRSLRPRDGLGVPGDKKPYRRYLMNLFSEL